VVLRSRSTGGQFPDRRLDTSVSSSSFPAQMTARWVVLPVFGAHLAHAPVLRFDLLPKLARPIDGAKTFRGRRLFGANKTWRGAAVMFCGALGATLALSRWPWYRSRLPPELCEASPLLTGALLGAGVVVGELPNSFLKRQLNVPPGERSRSLAGTALSLFDQVDFVPATCLLLRPVFRMSRGQLIDATVFVAIVHLPINVVGYAIGARTTPI